MDGGPARGLLAGATLRQFLWRTDHGVLQKVSQPGGQVSARPPSRCRWR